MNPILTIAKKELRGYFLSPVALIFLATFLFVVLFSFFWVDTFFRRNIADVRPLFHWLPILLIFLVGALTMRLWSEEQRAGTLEILLTLPVKTYQLVLGKFVAGIALVAVALALTLGLPITVSLLGQLDWGPVFGGYLAALLLAGAYLAIGLCISSTTDNPIVALILTCLGCGLLYAVGSDTVASFAGNEATALLRALGSGSRFESIQRGVIDLRDLLYYGSLTVGFLFINTAILEAKRWSHGANTQARRTATKVAVGLVAANLLLLNVGLASVHRVRIDLTERGEYSISPVTEKLLKGLDAPLLIRGYFSAKTHPLLAPLVPRIRDMIEEYGAVGGDRVRTEWVDPQKDPAAEKEANEDYGVKSVPFQFADRHEAAVVNSYFNILVKYGDKHAKLGFEDLIEVKVTGIRDIEVKLRNLEYDLTRAIKKVVYGFQPLETLFARVSGKVTLTAYITAKTLPENLAEIPGRIDKVAQEIEKRSAGKFSYKVVDPYAAKNQGLPEKLHEKYGLKPLALSLFGDDAFYLHLVLETADKHERLFPAPEMSEGDLREAITAALKRLAPGFLKTVGVITPSAQPQQPPHPMMRRPPPQQRRFQLLRQRLSDEYTVRSVQLKDGRVPPEIDVLLLVGPDALDDKQRFAIDQFLMRGGAVVVCAGRYASQEARGGLTVKKVESRLDELLAAWGVKLEDALVFDLQNEAFPVPVTRDVMGLQVQELRMVPYPLWVDVRAAGMAEGNVVVSGLPSVTLQWASPLELEQHKGVESTVLLQSSEQSWTKATTEVQPDFGAHPEHGFAVPAADQMKRRPLAVTLRGVFSSAFEGKASPLLGGDGAKPPPEKKDDERKGPKGSSVLERSPKSARLAVVGSSDFISDDVLTIARQTGPNNLQLLQNLVDWAVADVDMLSIRSRGTFARTLEPLDDSARSRWELINYALVVVALGLLVGGVFLRRRRLEPMTLTDPKDEGV